MDLEGTVHALKRKAPVRIDTTASEPIDKETDTTPTNPTSTKTTPSASDKKSTDPLATITPNKPLDVDFAYAAAEIGYTEVKLAQLGVDNARAKEVKEFAQMLVKEHRAINAELKQEALEKGIMLPGDCQSCQSKYNQLAALKGKDFDKKFAEIMIADHKEAIAKFLNESGTGQDAHFKEWASIKLPMLERHLEMAEKLKAAKK